MTALSLFVAGWFVLAAFVATGFGAVCRRIVR